MALAGLALAAGSADAAPARDALIRPGVGIGKVRVGMTFAQVRAALGRPEALLRQQRYGFGSRYAEYAWNGTDWTVGITGRGNTARVVMVATGLPRERTRLKVGVGSTEKAVRRTPGVRCFGKEQRIDPVTGVPVYVPSAGKDTMSCFLGGRRRNSAHTTFALIESCRIPTPFPVHCPASKRVYSVYEVRVGEPRFIWGYPD